VAPEIGTQPSALRRLAVPLALAVLLVLAGLAVNAWLHREGPPGPNLDEGAATPIAIDGAAPADERRAELTRFLERHPRDGRAWVLLAYVDMEAGRYEAAAASFEKALAASPKVAADPAVWCEYADAVGMAQGGSLAGRPTEFVMRALALRPEHPKALEMAGSAAYERRDFREAARYWRQLLPQLQPDSQPQRELTAAIARAERLAAMQIRGGG